MVRPFRIEYPNAWYHVTCRGIERSNIFRDDNDRKRFLEVLGKSAEVFHVEVHCYVLMSNHFHFLLKTPEANLSRFMQRFNTAYTTYFNLRHKRAGHLYQGRYKALLVEADEYLLELSRYIHLNPVRIKKYRELPIGEQWEMLKRYRWSSLCAYIRGNGRDEFMHYGMVLDYMGGDDRKGRERYQDFVVKGLSGKLESPLKAAKGNAILGSDSFIVWVKERFLSGEEFLPQAYSHLKTIREPVGIRKIAEAVAKEYGIEAEEIIKKRSKFREARQVLLEISHRLNLRKRSMRQMGAELGGISGEQISQAHNAIQAKLQRDSKLQRRIETIFSQL